jgi:3-methyladenine DNA glycosylase Tag
VARGCASFLKTCLYALQERMQPATASWWCVTLFHKALQHLLCKFCLLSSAVWHCCAPRGPASLRTSLVVCPSALACRTPESEALSKALKTAGMTFVGPTIMYAFMQAAGLVNDHLVSCHCRSAPNSSR